MLTSLSPLMVSVSFKFFSGNLALKVNRYCGEAQDKKYAEIQIKSITGTFAN